MAPSLKSMYVYPVKSCDWMEVSSAVVEPWGLAGDRRWLVTDESGVMRTQRKFPTMSLIRAEYDRGVTAEDDQESGSGSDYAVLRLNAPGMPELVVIPRRRADGAAAATVNVWRFHGLAAQAWPEADAWLSTYLGQPSRLAYMDDTSVRAVNPDFGKPEDRVSFADGYPLLLAATSSLDDLNEKIAGMGGEPVPMERFRPSIVIEGTEAWAEEDWKRVQVGDQVFRVAKPCARCQIPTIDPERGEFAGQQPLKALRKYRRVGRDARFGMNLIPDTLGTLRLGDALTVLD